MGNAHPKYYFYFITIIIKIRRLRKIQTIAMKLLTSEEVKKNFANTLDRVADGAEHIAIKHLGKDTVYLISAEDYELFQQLLREAEDKIDLKIAESRMNDPQQKTVSFDDFFNNIEA